MDLEQWNRIVPELAKRYLVVTVDPRGFGQSDNPTSSYSDADDLRRIQDHLELDRVGIIGLSSAGGLVLEYALRFPDRVAGVVSIAPFFPGFEFSAEMRERLDRFSEAAKEGREPFLDAMLGDPHFAPSPLDQPIRDFIRENMARNYDKGAGFDPSLVIEISPPLIERLTDIQPPVLLLIGALDHSEVARRNRFVRDQIPAAVEKTVESAGHNMPLENPRGFLQAVGPFLADLPAGD